MPPHMWAIPSTSAGMCPNTHRAACCLPGLVWALPAPVDMARASKLSSLLCKRSKANMPSPHTRQLVGTAALFLDYPSLQSPCIQKEHAEHLATKEMHLHTKKIHMHSPGEHTSSHPSPHLHTRRPAGMVTSCVSSASCWERLRGASPPSEPPSPAACASMAKCMD